MLKHIVCWKLKGNKEERKEVITCFQEAIDYLNGLIPEIQSAVVGVNLYEEDGYHVCIDAVFRDKEELQRYINHPEHLKVREYMTEVSFEKTVFDYLY